MYLLCLQPPPRPNSSSLAGFHNLTCSINHQTNLTHPHFQFSPPFSILTPILVFILYHQPPSLILTNFHPVLKMNKRICFLINPFNCISLFSFHVCVTPALSMLAHKRLVYQLIFAQTRTRQAQHGPKNWVVADSNSDPPFVLDLNSSSRLLSIRP